MVGTEWGIVRTEEVGFRKPNILVSSNRNIEGLNKIYEARLIYTNGVAERILSETDQTQRQLAQALGLYILGTENGYDGA